MSGNSEVNYHYIRKLFEDAPAKMAESDGEFDPTHPLHLLTLRIEILAAILSQVMDVVNMVPDDYAGYMEEVRKLLR